MRSSKRSQNIVGREHQRVAPLRTGPLEPQHRHDTPPACLRKSRHPLFEVSRLRRDVTPGGTPLGFADQKRAPIDGPGDSIQLQRSTVESGSPPARCGSPLDASDARARNRVPAQLLLVGAGCRSPRRKATRLRQLRYRRSNPIRMAASAATSAAVFTSSRRRLIQLSQCVSNMRSSESESVV